MNIEDLIDAKIEVKKATLEALHSPERPLSLLPRMSPQASAEYRAARFAIHVGANEKRILDYLSHVRGNR